MPPEADDPDTRRLDISGLDLPRSLLRQIDRLGLSTQQAPSDRADSERPPPRPICLLQGDLEGAQSMSQPARRLRRHPRAERVLVVCLLLPCGAARAASDMDEFKVKRQEVFEFTEKPKLARDGDNDHKKEDPDVVVLNTCSIRERIIYI
jgi:hypothetical protein